MDFARLIEISQKLTETLLEFSNEVINWLFIPHDFSPILGAIGENMTGIGVLGTAAVSCFLVRIILAVVPVA